MAGPDPPRPPRPAIGSVRGRRRVAPTADHAVTSRQVTHGTCRSWRRRCMADRVRQCRRIAAGRGCRGCCARVRRRCPRRRYGPGRRPRSCGQLIGFLEVPGDEEDGHAVGGEHPDDFPHGPAAARIEPGGRFVEETPGCADFPRAERRQIRLSLPRTSPPGRSELTCAYAPMGTRRQSKDSCRSRRIHLWTVLKARSAPLGQVLLMRDY